MEVDLHLAHQSLSFPPVASCFKISGTYHAGSIGTRLEAQYPLSTPCSVIWSLNVFKKFSIF